LGRGRPRKAVQRENAACEAPAGKVGGRGSAAARIAEIKPVFALAELKIQRAIVCRAAGSL
jgi:hypothetical protein